MPYPHAMGRLLGENLRQTIKAASEAGAFPYSVSIGVATCSRATPSLAELFAMADRRLYAAKGAGRDRVVGEGSDLLPEAREARRA